MVHPLLPVWIGLRYNRSSDKQRFLSLLSWVSLVGMILGVSALIIVLSVMNGFQAELRDRMLDLIAHGQVESANDEVLYDWQNLQQRLQQQPGIIASAPLVGGNAMISAQGILRAVELQGINIDEEQKISRIAERIVAGRIEMLEGRRYGIVLGSILARSLGVSVGDTVAVILPKMTITPAGLKPRIKQFTLVAIFEVGAEMDSTYAYIHLTDAQRLYQTGSNVHAIRYLTNNVLSADITAHALMQELDRNGQQLDIVPWTKKRAQLFSAVKMEKTMVTFMLSMVILVAAFNLISVLSMMVSDKRNEVAVLRMMGMGRQNILAVFLTQGLSLAVASIVVGGGIGILVSLNLSEFVHAIEDAFGFYIFDPRVFYVSGLPSDLHMTDVLYVFSLSLLLSVVFTMYPAYRASTIQPVEALQYQ